jgi:hypothetical protein
MYVPVGQTAFPESKVKDPAKEERERMIMIALAAAGVVGWFFWSGRKERRR